MSEKYSFKPRARLLAQLGDQLIRNEAVAIVELVKNAYDADASQVEIYLDLEADDVSLSISDNGSGMNKETILNNWLIPGTDNKSKLFVTKELSPKYKRLPIGEKGIGRFGVHKLGNKIELWSKKKGSKEVKVTIDWTELDSAEFMDDFSVRVTESSSGVFKRSETGTHIEITNLKKKWTKKDVRNVFRALNTLSSPFEDMSNFNVDFDVSDSSLIEELLTWNEIKKYAMYYFDFTVAGNTISSLEYNFTPYRELKKINKRSVTHMDEEVRKRLKLISPDKLPLHLEDHDVGEVRVRGYIFDRDNYTLSLTSMVDKKGFRDYLRANTGVKVFRDGLRVYDYGEPGNDWLGLDLSRVNSPTKGLSNNLIISSVEIERSSSTDLKEKTNREGFVENVAYDVFSDSVKYGLSIIQSLRYSDKLRLREIYSGVNLKEPVLEPLRELKSEIDKRIRVKTEKKEIYGLLDKVEKEYLDMKNVLLQSSSSGLSLGMAIHEIEKIILELLSFIKNKAKDDKISKLVYHLNDLVDNYANIIRSSSIKKIPLAETIDFAKFNTEYRFDAHNVKLVLSKSANDKSIKIEAPSNLITSTLMNLFDNSIYWFSYSGIGKPIIYVDLIEYDDGDIAITVIDNGPGFTIPTKDAKRIFVTGKTNGMGMGLHIASEIMSSIGGELLLDDRDYVEDVPKNFKIGAVVTLLFKAKK